MTYGTENAEEASGANDGGRTPYAVSGAAGHRHRSPEPLASHMKLIRYTVVVLSFLVGWIGVGVVVSHCMFNLGLTDTRERHVLTDWLSGSLLGLPVGIFLAYVMDAGLKDKYGK